MVPLIDQAVVAWSTRWAASRCGAVEVECAVAVNGVTMAVSTRPKGCGVEVEADQESRLTGRQGADAAVGREGVVGERHQPRPVASILSATISISRCGKDGNGSPSRWVRRDRKCISERAFRSRTSRSRCHRQHDAGDLAGDSGGQHLLVGLVGLPADGLGLAHHELVLLRGALDELVRPRPALLDQLALGSGT